jgi:hypothetical protein
MSAGDGPFRTPDAIGLPAVYQDRPDTGGLNGLGGTPRTRESVRNDLADTDAHGGRVSVGFLNRVRKLRIQGGKN